MIVKLPNKSEQLIRNVELVHPENVQTKMSAYHYECLDCHKKGQFPGAIVCKCCNK